MPDKPDKTASYGEPRREHAAPSVQPGSGGVDTTQRGVGVDRRRPPQRIDPGTRKVGRTVGVGLAMGDPFERASVARTLVQAGCNVEILTSPGDLKSIDVTTLEVLVADFDASDIFAIVDAVGSAHYELPLLAWTARKSDVDRGLRAMKYSKFEVLDRKSRMPDLVESVKRLSSD
jgi:hypothetical protein